MLIFTFTYLNNPDCAFQTTSSDMYQGKLQLTNDRIEFDGEQDTTLPWERQLDVKGSEIFNQGNCFYCGLKPLHRHIGMTYCVQNWKKKLGVTFTGASLKGHIK